jgi:hypothetical protein
MKIRLIFGLFLTMISGLKINAQELKISFDKDSILIGDHIILSIEANAPYNADIFLPKTDSLGYFEFIEILKSDTTPNSIYSKWLITCFDSGYYAFGPIPALFVSENKQKIDTVFSNAVLLYVNTLPVDTAEAFMPIKATKQMPYPWREVLPTILIALAALLLIAALIAYLIYRRKKKKAKAEKVKTPLEFFEEALQKLEDLDRQKLWQKDQIKEYYFSLSETLRNYLEGRFGVNAMEMTTDEIIRAVHDQTNEGLKKKLNEILSQADLAKYAKFKPMGDENMRMIKMAKDFVLHTKPKVVKEENETVE